MILRRSRWIPLFALAALMLSIIIPSGWADEKKAKAKAAEKTEEATDEAGNEKVVDTKHTVAIGGKKIEYQARAGTILLKEEDGKAKASIFYVAYTKLGVKDLGSRPVTFSFNGGPGSSSVWLHLGILGPRRVKFDDEGMPLPPPYRLVDNEYSILDRTDLVFIDPVSTGYSRAAEDGNAKEFHGVEADIESVGKFIRLYTTRHKRWSSPKFLIGESYGTTRAAGLAGHLQESLGMYLNGIMLISSVIDFQTISFNDGNDLPYALFLPSYTASAWYHKRLSPELQEDLGKTLKEAEAFARDEFFPALMKGSALSDQDSERLAGKLADYTGLSVDYIQRSNLKIPIWRFVKELLRDERRTVGRFDSRYQGIDRDAAGDNADYDPSYTALQGPFTATLYDYLRAELKYESDLPYEILSPRVWPWNYGSYQNRYLNFSETLRKAMTINPSLKVFVGSGYFDLATPWYATDYTFDRLGLDPSLRDHVTMKYYDAGHMMYVHKPSLVRMKADLAEFIEVSSK